MATKTGAVVGEVVPYLLAPETALARGAGVMASRALGRQLAKKGVSIAERRLAQRSVKAGVTEMLTDAPVSMIKSIMELEEQVKSGEITAEEAFKKLPGEMVINLGTDFVAAGGMKVLFDQEGKGFKHYKQGKARKKRYQQATIQRQQTLRDRIDRDKELPQDTPYSQFHEIVADTERQSREIHKQIKAAKQAEDNNAVGRLKEQKQELRRGEQYQATRQNLADLEATPIGDKETRSKIKEFDAQIVGIEDEIKKLDSPAYRRKTKNNPAEEMETQSRIEDLEMDLEDARGRSLS